MITIRFPDAQAKHKALGFLAGRFSFTSWATGEIIVPEDALPAIAQQGIHFSVEGPATYEQTVPVLRNASPTQVQ